MRPPQIEARATQQPAQKPLAATDPEIHKLMLEVSGLLKPASVLREPEVAARIAAEMRDA
jgi:hypothetical protein